MPSTVSLFLFPFIIFFFLFSASVSLDNRRILHQPLDSLPPSTQPPAPTTPAYPFSASTPNNSPFFPDYPSPPPPPSPASLASFPANVSSITVPQTSKPNPASSKLVATAVACVAVALVVVSVAVALHFRKKKSCCCCSSSSSSSESKTERSDTSTRFNYGDNAAVGNTVVPKLRRPSQPSSEFLYLGTMVNSHTGIESHNRQNSPSSTSAANSRKLDSPELQPLPPLLGRNFTQNYDNGAGSGKDEEDEEFYSPRGSSLGGRESSIGIGSASRGAFAALEVENFGASNDSSSSSSSSGSGSPRRSVSLSISPPVSSSPKSSRPKSPELVSVHTAFVPPPTSSSPERDTRTSIDSTPRTSHFWDQNIGSPVGISSPRFNSPVRISSPVIGSPAIDPLPRINSPIMEKISGPVMESPPRINSPGVESPLRISSPIQEFPVRVSSHNLESPVTIGMECPVMESPPRINSPGVESPLRISSPIQEFPVRVSSHNLESPVTIRDQGMESLVRISSTVIDSLPVINGPVIESPPRISSPIVESPPGTNSPGMESPGRFSCHGLRSPVRISSPDLQSPERISSPARTSSPGMESPGRFSCHGLRSPVRISTPDLQSPERISSPARTSNPGMESPWRISCHGLGSRVRISSPDLQSPERISTPARTSSPGMESPGRFSCHGLRSPVRISSPDLQSPERISSPARTSSPGMESPGRFSCHGLRSPVRISSPDLQSPERISIPVMGSPVCTGSPVQQSVPTLASPSMEFSVGISSSCMESPVIICPLHENVPTLAPHISIPSRPPPPPPPLPPSKHWESPRTPNTHPHKVVFEPPILVNPLRSIAIESPTLISPIQLPSHLESAHRNSDIAESCSSENVEKDKETPKPKLKPLHWDKVRASSDREMVWDHLKTSSFKLNEEMIETLFVVNTPNTNPKETSPCSNLPSQIQENRVLDPKKSQNIAITLRALNFTTEEVCDALLEGNADSLGTELLESLMKMAPTKEEELKLKEHTDNSPFKLGPAEKFVKAVLDIPFAFKRVDAMLYKSNFESEVDYLKKSFETVEAACEELRSSRMFLKLLEAVLKTGNRMNVGTNRGDAHAFKLDTLLKLVDIKGGDGRTSLLHFVVEEIIRSEGARLCTANQYEIGDDVKCRKLGLQVVSSLSSELRNVKKAAGMDSEVLHSDVLKLSKGMMNIAELSGEAMGQKISESMKRFTKMGEEEIIKLQALESVAMSLVKEITEYFHGDSGREEAHPLRIFMVVRDFLMALERVCKEVGMINERTIVSSAHKFPVPVNPMLQQPAFPAEER